MFQDFLNGIVHFHWAFMAGFFLAFLWVIFFSLTRLK